jgi:hypothetical protein
MIMVLGADPAGVHNETGGTAFFDLGRVVYPLPDNLQMRYNFRNTR